MDLEMKFSTAGNAKDAPLDDAAREKIANFVNDRVGDLRCTDHDRAPTVVCSGESLDSLHFEVQGCCQKIIHLTQTKLAE